MKSSYTFSILIFVILILTAPGARFAEAATCTAPNGDTFVSDGPCPGSVGAGGNGSVGAGGDGSVGAGGDGVDRTPSGAAGKGFTPISITDPVNMSIEDIFRALLDIILVFAVPIIVFFIIWAGFLYVTAAGNQDQLSKAHKALLYALIGGLLVLGANVLLAVITNTIKVFAG